MSERLKKIQKRTVVLYVSIAIIAICLSYRFSYAFFTTLVKGNDSTNQTVIKTGNLEVTFLNAEYINNSKMRIIPASDIENGADKSTFSIKNTGNMDAKYILRLNDVEISDNLKSADFKWELLIDGQSVKKGNFSSAQTGKIFNLMSTPLSLTKNQTSNCVFRMWLEESNKNQNGLTEGTFSSRIEVVATT